MKVAYFDCFSGASGDMILGALLDSGLSRERLQEEIGKLRLSDYDVQATRVTKRGIAGTQAMVSVEQARQEHRHLHHILEILGQSDLEERVKLECSAIFTRLAEAEAQVHQTPVDNIHFHECGAMDAIIDVVGSAAGLAAMGVERVYCSPFHVGTGTVQCAHGTLPVPVPATVELIKGKPSYSTGIQGELLTPTGAAILTTLSSGFGPMPAMTIEAVGYGAGRSDFPLPNLLRLVLGDAAIEAAEYEHERVAVGETTIDDMNPQMYDYIMERMLRMGALDVFLVPVQMKKNRPGTLLTLICTVDAMATFSNFLLKETTTIGLRWRIDERIKAERYIREFTTRFGPVACKVAHVGNTVINVSPEYDDCKRVAREANVPLKEVMEEARSSALGELRK